MEISKSTFLGSSVKVIYYFLLSYTLYIDAVLFIFYSQFLFLSLKYYFQIFTLQVYVCQLLRLWGGGIVEWKKLSQIATGFKENMI